MALLRQSIQMTSIRNAPQADEHYILIAERYMMESYQTIDSMRQVAENTGIGYDRLRHIFKSLRGKSLAMKCVASSPLSSLFIIFTM